MCIRDSGRKAQHNPGNTEKLFLSLGQVPSVLTDNSGIDVYKRQVLELFIHIPFRKREFTMPVIPTMAADLKEGFSYVGRNPLILRSMILASLLNLVLTPFFVVGGPVILRTAMKSTDAMYGIGMGTINLATILGALSMGCLLYTSPRSVCCIYPPYGL